MTAARDYSGLRVGKLVAAKPTGNKGQQKALEWLTRCDCGGTKLVSGAHWASNKRPRSCDDCVTRLRIDQGAKSREVFMPQDRQAALNGRSYSEVDEELSAKPGTVKRRLSRGWPAELAVSLPLGTHWKGQA